MIEIPDALLRDIPKSAIDSFKADVMKLHKAYSEQPNLPTTHYNQTGDQLEVYWSAVECYATEEGHGVRLLRACSSQLPVGIKVIGLLSKMQPKDVSTKFMLVTNDIAFHLLERYDERRREPAFTFNMEEERFFFWVNLHWPAFAEKFPWLPSMRG